MEIEDQEQEILLQQEAVNVYSEGGAVNSVNGYTGDVILTTSDLANTSGYQNSTQVQNIVNEAIAGKQDKLTAGDNITIVDDTISATDTKYTAGANVNISSQNVISATNTTYSAGTGLNLSGTQFSVNTNTIATKQDVTNEATARENADINLQGQIDAISASSDVTDIVGTYADLQAYDTTHLKDNDIIKVLQDESKDGETTYYRWSTTTQSFTLIGEEGPYYTKSATDLLLADKQDKLTAGSNIAIAPDNTISATDTTYTAGTNVQISSGNVISSTDTTYSAGNGLSLTGTTFAADTSVLATQTDLTTKQDTLTAGSNIAISAGNVISATDTTYSNFVGTDGTSAGTAGLVPAPATTDAGKFLKADGTWDTAGGGGGGVTVVQTTGTSTTDVMSQNATASMVFADPGTDTKIKIGNNAYATMGNNAIEIGHYSKATGNQAIAIGGGNSNAAAAKAAATRAIAIGPTLNVTEQDAIAIGYSVGAGGILGEGSVGIGNIANTGGGKGCVALGYGSQTGMIEVNGVVSIGNLIPNVTSFGYNNSAYRLLTGLYDGQNAHDAATLAQGNTLATSAPTTSTVGVLGQLYTDTTNMHTYQCTAISGDTYTWTQRW